MLLLILLIIINLKTVYDIITLRISVFNPVAIFSLTVITQMFPQIVVLYNNNRYDEEFIPNVLLFMVLCQLAFQMGFKYGFFRKKSVQETAMNKVSVWDFSARKMLGIVIVFIGLGFIPMMFYRNLDTVYGGINVILNHFRVIGIFGYIIGFIYLERFPGKHRFIVISLLVAAAVPILYFAFFVKGSREITFTFVLVTLIFISRFKPKLSKTISILFFCLFVGGALIGESIGELRTYNKNKNFEISELTDIDYVGNLQTSMYKREITNGMDLGNCLLLMSYISNRMSYDLGTGIWNDFVFNFVPGRFVGEKTKETFYIDTFENLKTRDYENSLRNDITTITGYGSAFRSFSYLGFVLFYLVGAMLASFKRSSAHSYFFLFVYISCLTVVPNMVTHTMQYMFARIEVIFIFLLPIFFYYLAKKKAYIARTYPVKISK